MFKSSSSKRTAILVISISSSGCESTRTSKHRLKGLYIRVEFFFVVVCLFKRQMDSPSRRGCRTASDSRLTTVSRPFTSADTAYMVVSLKCKGANVALSDTTSIKQLLHGKPLWKTEGIVPPGTDLDVWQSQIPPCFSNVRRISSLLPYWAVDCREETLSNKKHDTWHWNYYSMSFTYRKG